VAKETDKYTDPELRERLKEEIQAGDRGGRPGQWSARKAQLLVKEYEKAGGGYRGEKSEEQRHLEEWTKEEWQTEEGETSAREGDETKRYLPKSAWEKMSPEEREETEEIKHRATRKGEQYAPNTDAARAARKEASEEAKGLPIEGYDDLSVGEAKGVLDGLPEGDLREVRDYEKGHKDRKTLVEWLERRLRS
jgi:hypothetical protein